MKGRKFLSLALIIAMTSSSGAWAIDPAEMNNQPQDRPGFQNRDVRNEGGELQVGNNARIQAGQQVRQVLAGAPPVQGLQDAIQNLPVPQQRQAAVQAAAVMANPQAAAAIAALPPNQQAAAVLAVAAMPGTMDQKVAAARMLAGNPAVLAAVTGAAGGHIQQGQMLSVLSAVPPAKQAQVAQALQNEPRATAALAAIPAGNRVVAMRIVGNIAAQGHAIDVGVATAVANPQARGLLDAMAPADQARFAPVLSNASIARVVAAAPAGARTAMLEMAVTVAAAPGTAGIQRDRNLTALAGALSSPAGQALMALPGAARQDAANMIVQALNGAPATQQAAIISAGVQVLGNPNLRAGLATVPAGQLGGAMVALARLPAATQNQIARLPAGATAAVLQAAAAAPANQRTAVMSAGARAMAIPGVAAAIQALPNVGQQAAAMQTIGNASIQTKAGLATLAAPDLAMVVTAAASAPANQRSDVLAAGVRAMNDPASAAVVRGLPANQQTTAMVVLGSTSGQTRTNFINALNAAPAALKGDMLQAVAAAPATGRGTAMAAVTKAMGNPGIAAAIAALPDGQRGQAMVALGSPNISDATRNAFGAALLAVPAGANQGETRKAMITAVLGVGGGPRGAQAQATMVGLVARAMGNPVVRDAIMASPAPQRAGLIMALGKAGPAGDAMRAQFAQAYNIPAVANLPRAQRAPAAAAIAAAPNGVTRFQSLPAAAQARIVDLAKAMASPNAAVMSRALNLMGNRSFANALARLPQGTQMRVLATAAAGAATGRLNPVASVQRIAAAGPRAEQIANMWTRQNLPRDLLRT